MTAVVRLTRAELRKLATTRTFLITLAIAIALAVISVAADAAVAGRNGKPALGTDASTYQMLGALTPAAAVTVLGAYTITLFIVASQVILRRDAA